MQRATELANQMLALAKVEQLRHQGDALPQRWDEIVRAVALDVSALIAEARLEFDIETVPVRIRGHEWALRELTRNLLHNAIRHTPAGGQLAVRLVADSRAAALTVADSGPGLAPEMRDRLFQPFSAGGPRPGSGLGLAICLEIVQSLGGQIELNNRLVGTRTTGLDAIVRLPLELE